MNYIPKSSVDTLYNGRLFRSRLEARWAVFFDVLGLKYEFEPEKYDTAGGRYIPDFWLPWAGEHERKALKAAGAFWEVKGAPATEQEISKAKSLARTSEKTVFVASGSDLTNIVGHAWVIDESTYEAVISQCPFCGDFGVDSISGENIFNHLCDEQVFFAKAHDVAAHFTQNLKFKESPLILFARDVARSARFETPEWRESLEAIRKHAQELLKQGVFCAAETKMMILEEALEWKAAGQYFDFEPWWVAHRAAIRDGVSLCPCYSCAADRTHKK